MKKSIISEEMSSNYSRSSVGTRSIDLYHSNGEIIDTYIIRHHMYKIGYHLQTSKYHFYYFRWGLRATRIYQTTLQTSSDLRRFIRCKRYQINIHPKPFKKYIHSFNRHSSVASYYHTAFLPVLYCSKTDLRRAEYAKLAIT